MGYIQPLSNETSRISITLNNEVIAQVEDFGRNDNRNVSNAIETLLKVALPLVSDPEVYTQVKLLLKQ